MSELTDKNFIPSHALIIYHKRRGYYTEDDAEKPNNTFLESHEIHTERDGTYSFSEARPLPYDLMNLIAKNFQVKEEKPFQIRSKGLIYNKLLYFRPQEELPLKIVWEVPSHKRTMFFHIRDKDEVGNIEDAEVIYPRLIFNLTGSVLNIYALPVNASITEKTLLYRPPFMNCYQSGSICAGTSDKIKVKFTYMEEIIQSAEFSFFNSRFSHGTGDKLLEQKDLYTFWREMAEGKYTRFPDDLLIASKYNIGAIL